MEEKIELEKELIRSISSGYVKAITPQIESSYPRMIQLTFARGMLFENHARDHPII